MVKRIENANAEDKLIDNERKVDEMINDTINSEQDEINYQQMRHNNE